MTSSGRTGLDGLLAALPNWTLVAGKGGVGKTTCAAALAVRSAGSGAPTLLLSTDPARSLGDALLGPDAPEPALGARPAPVAGQPRLDAFQLDAAAARDAFLARWRDTIVTIVDRGTYLDRDDIAGLVDAALPGADEAMALLTLLELEERRGWRRIVVDTAPTGHTLRLLELPATFRSLVALLDAMQDKHRFMVRALTHRYRADDADRFLREMARQADGLLATLRDPTRSAIVMVARAEDVVVAETARYLEALKSLGIALRALVVNAVPAERCPESDAALRALDAIAPDVPHYEVPLLTEPPLGLSALARWGETVRARGARGGPPPTTESTSGRSADSHRMAAAGTAAAQSQERRRGMTIAPDWLRGEEDAGVESMSGGGPRLAARPLTIVGGKGGVGKTTAACALALAAATEAPPVLLVSTDPAPSIADALEQSVADEALEVAGAPGLFARQMDAPAAFARFRDAYQAQVDAVFDSLTSGALDAGADRRISRDLLALAPPGIDELYALALLGETLAEARYRRLVVDPAPTGHLLRLLDMPALALDWTHRLLRLMLKYREVVGLGDAAQELLAFAKRTRAFADLLHDRARAGLLVVSLDEPLVRAETVRLLADVRRREIDVMGVLWNRASDPAALPTSEPVSHFVAPVAEPPPRGVEAIRRWHAGWRRVGDARV